MSNLLSCCQKWTTDIITWAFNVFMFEHHVDYHLSYFLRLLFSLASSVATLLSHLWTCNASWFLVKSFLLILHALICVLDHGIPWCRFLSLLLSPPLGSLFQTLLFFITQNNRKLIMKVVLSNCDISNACINGWRKFLWKHTIVFTTITIHGSLVSPILPGCPDQSRWFS